MAKDKDKTEPAENADMRMRLGEPGALPATPELKVTATQAEPVGIAVLVAKEPITAYVDGQRVNIMPGTPLPKGMAAEDIEGLTKSGAVHTSFVK